MNEEVVKRGMGIMMRDKVEKRRKIHDSHIDGKSFIGPETVISQAIEAESHSKKNKHRENPGFF